MLRLINIKQLLSTSGRIQDVITNQCRQISVTVPLYAAPSKKKKKIDPVMLKAKVERKIKKLEKAIRQLKKTPKQFKPLTEYQLTPEILRNLHMRKRKDTDGLAEVLRDFINLQPIWALYCAEKLRQEYRSVDRMITSQERALRELKLESEELYNSAVEIDETLIPFADNLIVKDTPKVIGYQPADGQKSDITKQWAM